MQKLKKYSMRFPFSENYLIPNLLPQMFFYLVFYQKDKPIYTTDKSCLAFPVI